MMDWINRPWMLDKMILKVSHDKLIEALTVYRNFQLR